MMICIPFDYSIFSSTEEKKSTQPIMRCMMSSPGVVFATAAAAVSGTLIFLAVLRRDKNFHPRTLFSGNNQDVSHSHPTKQTLRPCLCSGGKKMERKKKRVQFAESVKDQSGNGEEYRKKHKRGKVSGIQMSCRSEIGGMPANRVALYNGILRDRLQEVECSY